MAQLAENWRKKADVKAQVEHDDARQVEEQIGREECDSDKGARSPSLETKEEMDEKTEQHRANP